MEINQKDWQFALKAEFALEGFKNCNDDEKKTIFLNQLKHQIDSYQESKPFTYIPMAEEVFKGLEEENRKKRDEGKHWERLIELYKKSNHDRSDEMLTLLKEVQGQFQFIAKPTHPYCDPSLRSYNGAIWWYLCMVVAEMDGTKTRKDVLDDIEVIENWPKSN